MGNEVAAQKGTKGISFAVPAHLATVMAGAGGGNIEERMSTNALHFGGKEWSMTVNGETKVLQRRTEDGEMEKVQVLRVVVLDQGTRGRNYYETGFDADNPRAPDCWSDDSKRPHTGVEAPQCATCAECPKSVKGSRVVDGKEMIACSGFKMLAVLPLKVGQIAYDFPPLRMKLAPTSIWDGQDEESVAQGWYAWDNFGAYLRANGVAYTNGLVTRMRFASTNYPKVQFARGDFLDAEDFQKTLALAQSDDVKKLLAGFAPRPAGDTPAQKGKALPHDDDDTPAADPVFSQTGKAAEAAQAAETAKAKAAAKAAKDAEAIQLAEAAKAVEAKAKAKAAKVAAAKAAAEAAAAAAAAALKAAEEDDEGGGFDEAAIVAPPMTTPVAAAPKVETLPPAKRVSKEATKAPASAPAEVPPALTGILGEWE